MKKYRIHYANGTSEEIVSDETREQLLAQCKPITEVVCLDEHADEHADTQKKHKPSSKKGAE